VSGVAAPLAGAVEPRVLGERHEGGRGQALRGAGDYPLNHTAIFLFAPPRGHQQRTSCSSPPRRPAPARPLVASGRPQAAGGSGDEDLAGDRPRREGTKTLGDSNPCYGSWPTGRLAAVDRP
jgi:hypothetical protein